MTDPRASDTEARLAALKARRTRPTTETRLPGRRRSKPIAGLTATGVGLLAVSGLTVAFATQDSTPTTQPAATAPENGQPVVVVVRWTDSDQPEDPRDAPVVELAAQPSTRVATAATVPAASTGGSS